MWVTFISIITFLFFVFVASLFSIFLDQKEFLWKFFYLFLTWLLMFLISFMCSDILLKTFDSYLWQFVFLKNFQDLLTIKFEIALFFANNALILIFLYYVYSFLKEYIYDYEIFAIKIFLYSLIYFICYSIIFVRYDLFLSNWEVLRDEVLLNHIDIQIDYLTFVYEFIDEYFDFLKFLLSFLCINIGFLAIKPFSIKILYLRIINYLFLFSLQFYFFGWLLLWDFIMLSLISIFFIEIYIIFVLFLKNMQKIKLKISFK